MNNFKSGAGDLDFGSGSDDEQASDPADTEPADGTDATPEGDGQRASQETATDESQEYPYFVRRSNVSDERDVRLEAHVRDSVASQEGRFRSELAAELETTDISKTDAREFALLFAFQHPEQVAALMRDEGFGLLE